MGKKAVVLSGGGSKGSYQVGVWKALRRLHYHYNIVTGTSVGALNGVMMVQRDYRRCLKLWQTINFEKIFVDEFPNDIDSLAGKTKIYQKYAVNFIKNGGIDTSRFEQLIYQMYRPFRFFHSSVDYGIVTYNMTTKKAVEVTKKEMTEETAPLYIIASASCYPAFPKKKIGGEDYIDGGYSDNLPINLALSLGATEIVAVDLNAVGRKRKVKNKDAKITYISPRNQIVSFLVFNEILSRKAIQYGYNDTMKVFGKLEGDSYTFYLKERKKEYQKKSASLKSALEERLIVENRAEGMIDQFLKHSLFHRLLEDQTGKKREKFFYDLLEFIGKSLKVEDTKIYKMKDFSKASLEKLSKIHDRDFSKIEEKIAMKKVRSLFGSATVLRYLYDTIITPPKNQKERITYCSLALLFPKEFIAATYLLLLNEQYHIIS